MSNGMKLLFIVLNKEKHLEDVLSILVELGVSGATIIDSMGLGQFLAYEVPIFVGLRQLMGEEKTPSKTIFALIEGDKFLELKKILKEEGIDFTEPGIGIMFTVPVNEIVKSEEELT
ncbi:hypothetical protein KAW08_07170 [bacterium]|nr:hypothetical protein [bacterium]